MNTPKIIGAALILISLVLGYMGITKITQNDSAIKIVNIEIDISNKDEKQKGYLYLGVAALLFVGGVYSINKKA